MDTQETRKTWGDLDERDQAMLTYAYAAWLQNNLIVPSSPGRLEACRRLKTAGYLKTQTDQSFEITLAGIEVYKTKPSLHDDLADARHEITAKNVRIEDLEAELATAQLAAEMYREMCRNLQDAISEFNLKPKGGEFAIELIVIEALRDARTRLAKITEKAP